MSGGSPFVIPGVKSANQARSRATRDALIEALERLLQDRSLERISIQQLASEAGCSVGSVYRRFENKDSFLPVVVELASRRMTERMRSLGPLKLGSDGDLRTDLVEIARRTWVVLDSQAHLLRAAHLHARLDGEGADKPLHLLCDGVRQAIASALLRRRPDLTEPARRNAAAATASLLVSGLTEKALYPGNASAAITESNGPELAALLGDMAGRGLKGL